MELQLQSVNVGQPKQIGMRDGKPLMSAIAKEPISAQMIMVRALGLDGDAQANLVAHGGVDKAVYAYPSDHWEWWEKEKNFSSYPARFGENLTLKGTGEEDVSIGDRFSWGDAVVEISQPRSPCNKFQIYSGRPDVPALMTISGRAEGEDPHLIAAASRNRPAPESGAGLFSGQARPRIAARAGASP